jgi:hypothetical protein
VKQLHLFQAFWDHRQLIYFKHTHFLKIMVAFFVGVSLITTPNFFGLIQGIRQIDNLVGIEEAFTAMYNTNLPCAVNEEAEMSCQINDVQSQYGNYGFVYQTDLDASAITSSTLIFSQKEFAAIYIDNNNQAFLLTGTYQLLRGFDFRDINGLVEGDLVAHQADVTNRFVSNIYLSTIEEKMIAVYLSQWFQTLIFVISISLMMMILNLHEKKKKISLAYSLKMVTMNLIGPAFVSALLGLISPGWASVIFLFLYAFRSMFLYYYLHRYQNVLPD